MTQKKSDQKEQKKTRGVPGPVDIHVGKRLKLRRNLMGMSQDDLAREIGITFQQIQKYEHGTNRISAGKLYDFAKALNVQIGFFFEGLFEQQDTSSGLVAENAQEGFQYAPEKTSLENKETIDLIRSYYAIEDEKVRTRLLQFIKSVGESSSKEHVSF